MLHRIHSMGPPASGQRAVSGCEPPAPDLLATSVRVREGKRLLTDGPFAETREQLGGYFLIEGKNLDEALEVAGKIPMARKGTVEVPPVLEIEGLPTK